MADNNTKPISSEEYKKATEELYKQNLELARLYKEVDTLNKQRESLVHLVTHKVKSSFTHSKYIFAGLLDGTFGEISPELQKIAEEGLESDNKGINTVDMVLNSANLAKGTVKYNMKKLDLKDIVMESINSKKLGIQAKELTLEINIKDEANGYNITGDESWIKSVVNNLLENSIKYTKQGSISVSLEKTNNVIRLTVKDTGIGINEEDKKNLFTEGGRGKESVKINVDSTGYGLFSVKLIIDAHNGKVWGESEGEDKGSTFYVELPISLESPTPEPTTGTTA